jgi:hypothetical protein
MGDEFSEPAVQSRAEGRLRADERSGFPSETETFRADHARSAVNESIVRAFLSRASRLLARTDTRVGVIIVLCLIPRAVVAWSLPAACDDAYTYIHFADSLERGDLAEALYYLNINIYPIVLSLLHRLGLDWIVAGKLWGVLMGTLVVLPMYDWLRRMFDDRIATVAIFLYAVHPKIIEYTVEPIREATFWLFFVLCLDFLWRSKEERRWMQFVVAGASLALAVHTRIEGWLLLAPLAVWLGRSFWQNPAARMRLAFGTLLCLSITPLFVCVMNVTLLANHNQWELGRLRPFLLVAKWLHAPIADQPIQLPREPHTRRPAHPDFSAVARRVATPLANPQALAKALVLAQGGMDPAPSPQIAKPRSPSKGRVYLNEFSRSIGFVFIAFLIWGLVHCRRELLNPDKGILAALTVAALLAVWIRLTQIGNMNGRYFFIVLLIDGAFAAVGCLAAINWFGRRVGQRFGGRLPARSLPAVFFGCVLAAGWMQAFCHHHVHRDSEVRFGKWIREQAGAIESVACDEMSMRTAYVAAGGMPAVLTYEDFIDPLSEQHTPDLLIFSRSSSPSLAAVAQRAVELGMAPLDQAAFSTAKSEFVVFVRQSPAPVSLKASVDAKLTSLR